MSVGRKVIDLPAATAPGRSYTICCASWRNITYFSVVQLVPDTQEWGCSSHRYGGEVDMRPPFAPLWLNSVLWRVVLSFFFETATTIRLPAYINPVRDVTIPSYGALALSLIFLTSREVRNTVR